MKLISMTTFVLETIADRSGSSTLDYRDYAYNKLLKIENYAKFLKQPLTLGMFVPCDLDGNVLEEPKNYMADFEDQYNSVDRDSYVEAWYNDCKKYFESKERCLFEGFKLDIKQNKNRYISKENGLIIFASTENDNGLFRLFSKYSDVESLVKYNLQLTPAAIKQLGL